MKFIVNGGRKLSGEVRTLGSKNAATPIIAATLITERPCVIKNLPIIGDVLTMIDALESIGSEIEWLSDRSIRISNKHIDPSKLDRRVVRKIRSSILLVGPLLSRFGYLEMSTPGGCHIGVRPMDAHFDAFRELGAHILYDEKDDLYRVEIKKHNDIKEVILKEFSPTATENLLMFFALRPGVKIKIAAAESHVKDLGEFLQKMGAQIDGLGTHEIAINKSVDKKGGEIEYTIMNDPIEAGTFMVLGAATKSNITISGVPINSLTLPMLKLKEFGVEFEIKNDNVIINGASSNLRSVSKVMTQPYPGFPSDLQAPFGVLATQSKGTTLFFDTLYERRLKYLYELQKMGAKAEFLDPHRAIVKGPTKLSGTTVESIDLRAGATLVIAALVASGQSILHTAEQIDRGYERIEERLNAIGADIKRINS